MKTTMQLAAEAMISALDKTPRTNWEQTISMALQSMKDVGYAEGYRVGSFDLQTKQDKAAGPADPAENPAMASNGSHAMPGHNFASAGEDKTLANDKPSPEETLEDVGYEFLRVMARQIALTAHTLGVSVKDVQVSTYRAVDPGGTEPVARLMFDFKNPKL